MHYTNKYLKKISSYHLFNICSIATVFIVVLVFSANLQLTICQDKTKNKTSHLNSTTRFDDADKDESKEYLNYSSHLIENLVKDDYNRNMRPGFGEGPDTIEVSILISDISSISETEMEFKVDFYLRHLWFDPRLTFERKYDRTYLTLTEEFLNKIWMPDTFLVNAKKVIRHSTIRADKATLLRVYHDGMIFYSTRIIAVLQCSFNLVLFPFDQQKCSITLGSYQYTMNQLQFEWVEDHVSVSKPIDLPSFRILGYGHDESHRVLITGNYTRIDKYIIFERDFGYYLSQVYLPAFFIVVISWLPFWLDRNDHLGRVALGITTELTITTLITNTNKDFEKISYLKAIDIYLFVCFIMVFLTLIEFVAVGYYETILVIQKEEKRKKKLNTVSLVNADGMVSNLGDSICQNQKNSAIRDNDISEINKRMSKIDYTCNQQPLSVLSQTSIIDQWARWLFPITFILFNILYIAVIKFITENYSLSDIYYKTHNITSDD